MCLFCFHFVFVFVCFLVFLGGGLGSGVVLSKSGFCSDLGKFLSLGLGLNKQGNEGV